MRPCLARLARAALPAPRGPASRPRPPEPSLRAPAGDDESVGCWNPWRLLSKDDLQGELDLSRRGLRACDLTRGGDRCTVLIEERGVATCPAGRCEVGAVEDVENLSAQLHVRLLRALPEIVILEEGHIQVRQGRANDRVAAYVAERRARV